MTLILEVNDVPYENFISGSVDIRLDALCNSFQLEIVRSRTDALPFRVGDPCRILIDNTAVYTGSIEILDVEYDSETHVIFIQGRDLLGDLLDSTLDSIAELGQGISLKGIIDKILDQLKSNIGVVGIDGVEVVETTDTLPFNTAEDIASPESGENAFRFIEKWAKKRQVLLTSDGKGNIQIAQSTPIVLENAVLQNIIGAKNNNIIKGAASYDNTGRYNLYKMQSQLNPLALNNAGDTDLDLLVNQSGRVLDEEIRAGRQLVLSAESSFGETDDGKRAIWERNIRKARGQLYTAKVRGFKIGGVLWDVNRLVSIFDDFAGIQAQMLTNLVQFTLDEDGGETTTITFVQRDAYTISLEEPVSDDVGGPFG